MNTASTFTGPRWLGYVVSAIGLITLLIAAGRTPLIEWESGDFLLGGALAVIVIGFFIAALRGRINLIGNMKGKSAQILSIIGMFVAGFAIGNNEELNDDWAVTNILIIGIFIALAVLFFAAFLVGARKIREGK
jgi:membrane protein DedA with SNARE-associated domain